MYKKNITYTDYNGHERTEEFLFNLTEAEIAEMEMSKKGGLTNTLQRLIRTEDAPEIAKIFKDLILKSYGEKSDDGRRFIKTKEKAEEFSQTEAYSKLYMELAFDDKAAAEFINNIIPKSMAEQLKNKDMKEFSQTK